MLDDYNKYPDFARSSMLFADTLEEHYKIYSKFFNCNDIILDIGCGSGNMQSYIHSVGIDKNQTEDLTKFNTLNFSESIGHLTEQEIVNFCRVETIKKIVIKDFLQLNETTANEEWEYKFNTLQNIALPILAMLGYTVTVFPFIPSKNLWVYILNKNGCKYRQHTNLANVVCIAVRE